MHMILASPIKSQIIGLIVKKKKKLIVNASILIRIIYIVFEQIGFENFKVFKK
jgi:hypothetical protein